MLLRDMGASPIQSLRSGFNLFKFHTKTWLAGAWFTLRGKDRVRLDGAEVLVPYAVTDIRVRGQFQIGAYERRERRYLRDYLDPEASVLELGGCLGVVSCVANKLLRHPEHHVVVEANPDLLQYIENNRAHNDCRFHIEHAMVASQAVNTFYIGPSIGESSNRRKWSKTVTVPGVTVSALEARYGFRFDTLIMDIEGGELVVLRENRDWLRGLKAVFLEIHPHDQILSPEEVAECRSILEEAGLRQVVEDGLIWVFRRP
jgi:FkbM family methyltransferase